MSPAERVVLRWECCEESKLILEHVEAAGQVDETEFFKARAATERQLLFDAVEEHGNARAAARALKISYRAITNMLHKYEHPKYTGRTRSGRTVGKR